MIRIFDDFTKCLMEVKKMLDKFDIRYKVFLIWFLAFITVWLIFLNIFPQKSLEYQLDRIEASIEMKDWSQANKYTTDLLKNFKKYKLFIQMNNATEALTTYEQSMGQLETTVKHEHESALEYIGALRESTNLVIKPFSGP